MKGTSVDLAVLAALISSVRDKPVKTDIIVVGEVGLTGEIRAISRMADSLEEAYRTGWTRFVVPAAARGNCCALKNSVTSKYFTSAN